MNPQKGGGYHHIEIFRNMLESLAGKQQKFFDVHEKVKNAAIRNELAYFLTKVVNEFMKGKFDAVPMYGKLVISAKRLFMQIFSVDGEAARLDVFKVSGCYTCNRNSIMYNWSKKCWMKILSHI
jgi:hypothetical protein